MVLIIIKIVSCLCLTSLLLSGAYVEAAPSVSAHSAVIMADSGEVLFAKNADEKLPIASTTKIMTAIIVIENCKLDDSVLITAESCNIEGSSMYLKEGEKYTVRQLLQGMMLVSGNDAAHALALHTAGSIEDFAVLMNKKCQELAMNSTKFQNPHGLSEDDHYSSAEDMARLMVYCMQNEDFSKLTALKSLKLGEKSFVNHNKLLYVCPGCIGGKTGYTMAAGRCLVSACERDGSSFVCVTLAAPNDWNDHIGLYNWAYSQFSHREIADNLSFNIPVVSGKTESVTLTAEYTELLLPKKAELVIKAELPNFVFAPITRGECGGIFKAYCENECVAEGRLLYQNDVEVSKE